MGLDQSLYRRPINARDDFKQWIPLGQLRKAYTVHDWAQNNLPDLDINECGGCHIVPSEVLPGLMDLVRAELADPEPESTGAGVRTRLGYPGSVGSDLPPAEHAHEILLRALDTAAPGTEIVYCWDW